MRCTAFLLACAIAVVPRAALAWTDARPAGLVTELAIDREGGATVTLRIRWRILAGRFRTFELAELPADLVLLEATAADATGVAVAVATRIPAPSRLELTLGEDGGLRRGAIDVVVRYTTSLRAQSAVHRLGSDAVIEIATVPWERGLEAAELRIALPASVRRAQWLADDTPGVDATVASELGRDVVHAIRRHLPAGARWVGRVACDPALFTWLDRPRIAPQSLHHGASTPLGPVALLALALAAVMASCAAWLRRASNGTPIVPLPQRIRWLPIPLVATGAALQSLVLLNVASVVTLGGMLALAGLVLGIPRLAPIPAGSGPARMWPDERLTALRHGLERARAIPTIRILLTLATLAFAAYALKRSSALMGTCAVDALLLSLVASLTMRPLNPKSDALVMHAMRAAIARELRNHERARLVWRVRGDGMTAGSVAVRIVPRAGFRFARGVRHIEAAIVWHHGAIRWRAVPTVRVRVQTGSPLERVLRRAAVRVGRIAVGDTSDDLEFVAEWLGPDRRAILSTIGAIVRDAIRQVPVQPTVTREFEPATDDDLAAALA